jgi:hypothetical protein
MQIVSKRKSRPGRPAPPPSPAAPAASMPTRGPRPSTYELIERIVDLQVRGASLHELAQAVLPALLGAFGARAGALLVYHSEDGSLTLAGDAELSPAGREQLECLRPGAAGGWEIPLHGLLNRKAYIIERPHEHPFVPELVARDAAARIPNLAVIPLYRGQLPVGVLLVIADRRPLTDTEIVSHVLVYDVLSLALDAGLRARGETPMPLSAEAVQSLACEPWKSPLEQARQLEAQLLTATDERERLARQVRELEQRHTEALATLAEREAEYTRALEAEHDVSARLLAERETATAEELARARGMLERRLADERAHAEAAVKELQAALVDREATFEASVHKLQAAVADRDALLAERERAIEELAADRDRVREAAVEAGGTIRRLNGELERIREEVEAADAARARELETTRTLHERRIEEVAATHREQLGEAQAAASSALARAAAAEERAERLAAELAAARAATASLGETREEILTLLGHPGGEPAEALRALLERVAALEAELARTAAERGTLERRVAAEAEAAEGRHAAHRRELQELRAAHQAALEEMGATHRREAEEVRAAHRRALEQADAVHREQLAAERAELERTVAAERAEHERALAAGAAAAADAAARAEAATGRADALAVELEAVRAEATRLREERARVLAAVDDPAAEPAAVIRGFRERVVGLEGEVRALGAERGQLAARLATEAEAGAARVAEARAAAEAVLEELRASLRDRDATLAERARTLAELAREQERTRQAALEAAEVAQRRQVEIDRMTAEVAAAQAAHTEALARAAAATGHADAVEGELAVLREEIARLRAEREQVLAAVEDPSAEPAALIRALREQVTALEARLGALASERATLERRGAATEAAREEERAALRRELDAAREAHRRELGEAQEKIERLEALAAGRPSVDEQLAAAARERAEVERERAAEAARVAALERDLGHSQEMLAAARRQLERAVGPASAQRNGAPGPKADGEGEAREAGAAAAAPELAPAPPRVQVLEPPPAPIVEVGPHRLLEGNAALRERVAAALAADASRTSGQSAFVVNLLTAIPSRLEEVEAAARAGAVVIAYASDGGGRSCILGPVRCYAEPPRPVELLAAVERVQSPARIVTLWSDIDALLPIKAVLAQAGHSVSMACDAKQALDILGMLTPDAVLVDLRHAPETSAEFLAALGLDGARVLSLLVYGKLGEAILGRTVERLLRPAPLDAGALARACRDVLSGSQARAAKGAAERAARAADAHAGGRKPAVRRPAAKRR